MTITNEQRATLAGVTQTLRTGAAQLRARPGDQPTVLGVASLVENMALGLSNAFEDELLEVGGAPPRVLFCSPVTGKQELGDNVWGGDWFDATGFAVLYSATGVQAYHTGVDLNRPAYKDVSAPVYAAADGRVIFAGVCAGWKKQVIVIKHQLENGVAIYTRYAHVDPVYVGRGDNVMRGAKIALIGDYTPVGPQGDHLHFDVPMFEDIERDAGDWPGMNIKRLRAGYMDPNVLMKQRRQ